MPIFLHTEKLESDIFSLKSIFFEVDNHRRKNKIFESKKIIITVSILS